MTPEAHAVLSAAEAVAVSYESGWSYVLDNRLVRLRSAVIDHRVATRRKRTGAARGHAAHAGTRRRRHPPPLPDLIAGAHAAVALRGLGS